MELYISGFEYMDWALLREFNKLSYRGPLEREGQSLEYGRCDLKCRYVMCLYQFVDAVQGGAAGSETSTRITIRATTNIVVWLVKSDEMYSISLWPYTKPMGQETTCFR